MNAALSLTYSVHSATVYVLWVMGGTLALAVICGTIGSFIAEINGWLIAAGILVLVLIFEAIVLVGTIL